MEHTDYIKNLQQKLDDICGREGAYREDTEDAIECCCKIADYYEDPTHPDKSEAHDYRQLASEFGGMLRK